MLAFESVGIIGCGVMGAGIAEICALAGMEVTVVARSSMSILRGRARIERSLQRAISKGRADESEVGPALKRIQFTVDLLDAADSGLLIEAVVEHEALKREIFSELDVVLMGRLGIVASTSSSIPITRLANATRIPDRIIGLHFFNPAPQMHLVEVVPTFDTSAEVIAGVKTFVCKSLQKTVIEVPDRPGFIVNSLLVPFLLSAIRLVESGVAEPAVIDLRMMEGCWHPMGPLALCDLIGLDVVLDVANSLYAESGEPHLSAPTLLRRMVDAGRLGMKSGRGFHSFELAKAI